MKLETRLGTAEIAATVKEGDMVLTDFVRGGEDTPRRVLEVLDGTSSQSGRSVRLEIIERPWEQQAWLDAAWVREIVR